MRQGDGKRKGADLLVAPLKLNVRLSKCGPRSVGRLRRLVKRRNLNCLCQLLGALGGGECLDHGAELVAQEDAMMEAVLVSGIAYDKDQARVTVCGVPDRPGVSAALLRRCPKTASWLT